MDQLVEIAEEHLRQEEELLPTANKYMFTDTEAIITYLYAIDYYEHANPRLEQLANQAEARYSHFFLCEPDIEYEDSWERSGDVHRQNFHIAVKSELEKREIKYTFIEGTLETRIATVNKVLNDLF